MAWDGMGAFVRALEQRAELVRIRAPGRPAPRGRRHRRPRDEGGRPGAPLRERRRVAAFPLLINAYGSRARMSLALGVDDLEEHARAIDELVHTPRPVERARPRRSSRSSSPSSRTSRRASVADGPLPGRRADRRRRRSRRAPHPHVLAERRRPLHHAAAGHHPRPRDAASRNVGCYRMQKLDRRSTAMHWQVHKTGRAPLPPRAGARPRRGSRSPSPSGAIPRSPTRRPRRCPTGSTSGCSPASCASAPWRPSRARRWTSRSRPTPTSSSRATSTRARPLVDEGPFGDHTGYYTPVDRFPRFHVTALTHRDGRRLPGDARRPAADGGRVARARPPSACSCRCCGCSSPRSWT